MPALRSTSSSEWYCYARYETASGTVLRGTKQRVVLLCAVLTSEWYCCARYEAASGTARAPRALASFVRRCTWQRGVLSVRCSGTVLRGANERVVLFCALLALSHVKYGARRQHLTVCSCLRPSYALSGTDLRHRVWSGTVRALGVQSGTDLGGTR
eukprot:3941360-Rhodomonas_salina.1